MAYKKALMLGIGANFCVESRRGLLADLCVGFSALALATPAGNLLQEGVGEGKERERVTSLASLQVSMQIHQPRTQGFSLRQREGNKRKAPGKRLQEG